MKRYVVLDFETDRIQDRPAFPPRPVGLSEWWLLPGDEPAYWAWGHPSGNNCNEGNVKARLLDMWEDPTIEFVFHNSKFDLAVCYEYFQLPVLPWHRVHDTMFILFLENPHSKALDLKTAAAELLGMPPDERDEMAEWLWEHRKELHDQYPDMPRISKEKGKAQAIKRSTGEWISKMPADLVGPYANGDTLRTGKLFEWGLPLITEAHMSPAYDRERLVLPIFMENERLGLRVDLEALERDIAKYEAHRECVDEWLRERLGAPDLNLDADQQVAAALAAAGVVDDDKWTLTKTGKRSVSKKALTPDMYNDPEVASAFGYRNRLGTCLGTFMRPWLKQGRLTGGRIHTNWNQTRGGAGGTRTGRPSTSNPNLLNISKEFREGGVDGYRHPAHLPVDPLPLVRNYVWPDEGCVFLHRDFDGQELRVFGDVECGELSNAYQADPQLDVHDLVKAKMEALKGVEYDRTSVKITNFQSIYGGGLNALMTNLGITRPEAKEFKEFHDKALPGRKIVNNVIKTLSRFNIPIRTWGGRAYFAEEPRMVSGRMMDFVYKLLNYYVQGSAADITKEALIRFYYHPKRKSTWRFLVTVYDEINISVPLADIIDAMALLKECMESIELDVQMLSSPKVGSTWGGCKKPEAGESEDAFMARMYKELLA